MELEYTLYRTTHWDEIVWDEIATISMIRFKNLPLHFASYHIMKEGQKKNAGSESEVQKG